MEWNRLDDLKQQLDWAMQACERNGCLCESYQWLRAYKQDIASLPNSPTPPSELSKRRETKVTCGTRECPTCGGSGEVHSHNPFCWTCDGTGRVQADAKAVEVVQVCLGCGMPYKLRDCGCPVGSGHKYWNELSWAHRVALNRLNNAGVSGDLCNACGGYYTHEHDCPER